LNLFRVILLIYNEHLPTTALEFEGIHDDIGMTYFRSCNELEAKRCFDTALEFDEKNNLQGNPFRMGKIYHCQGHLYAFSIDSF
jgi:hypothetical protein